MVRMKSQIFKIGPYNSLLLFSSSLPSSDQKGWVLYETATVSDQTALLSVWTRKRQGTKNQKSSELIFETAIPALNNTVDGREHGASVKFFDYEPIIAWSLQMIQKA